jgi:hypothetical protein
VNLPKALLDSGADSGDQVRAAELLTETPLDRLESTVIALKRDRSPEIARKAMVERIARAPLAEFEMLKLIYLRHCGNTAE